MFAAPKPRYRIYTRCNSYWSVLRDLALFRTKRGADVERFEAKLADHFEVSHAVCTPMARVGIYLAIKGLIQPGQEVIMSPYTIADVVNMVLCAGGKPVFADIDSATCNIDAVEVERLLSPRVGAVLITHLHGLAAPASEIRDLCTKHGVPLIEDAAQAFGAKENGKRLGTIGDVGIYSLGMFKNINAWYGGVVVSNRKDVVENARQELETWSYQKTSFILKRVAKGLATDLATSPIPFSLFTYWLFRYGFLHDVKWINRYAQTELDLRRKDQMPAHYQSRLTPMQARLALSQLNHIDSESQIRMDNARLYHEGLRDIEGITCPPLREDMSHIYTYYPIQVEDCDELLRWLMLHRRDVGAQHLKNCADLPGFQEFYRDCPSARRTACQVVLLPTYPRYGAPEVRKTIAGVRSFCLRDPVGGAAPA